MVFYTLLLIEAWKCLKFGETGQGVPAPAATHMGPARPGSSDSWHCSVKELRPAQRAGWVTRRGINVSSNYSAV